MRLFLSAGEPSGDLHGSNFVRTVRGYVPEAEVTGFGGPMMVQAGQKQLFPLAEYAVMGVLPVLKSLHTFTDLYTQANRYFQTQRPDAIVLIDYPGFHWWLAKAGHRHGIPVYYFVPPQIWAWATYRVSRMRRWVSHVFCNLPFEEEWYQRHGVNASFIGHPYFDAMRQQKLNAPFMEAQQRLGKRIVALLPGSRTHEVHDNVPDMLRTAERVHQAHPDVRFLVAAYKEKQAAYIREKLASYPQLPIEVHTQRTAEIIHLSDMCLAVSGSVSLELLHACKPTITLYRIGKLTLQLVKQLKKSKYISLINLLAERELSPEFLVGHDASSEMAAKLNNWLSDETARNDVAQSMRQLKEAVAIPGACERGVLKMLELLDYQRQMRRAA